MPKIAAVRATAHSRPFTGELVRLGLGANIKRDFVLVKVTADDGHVGYGESHPGRTRRRWSRWSRRAWAR